MDDTIMKMKIIIKFCSTDHTCGKVTGFEIIDRHEYLIIFWNSISFQAAYLCFYSTVIVLVFSTMMK